MLIPVPVFFCGIRLLQEQLITFSRPNVIAVDHHLTFTQRTAFQIGLKKMESMEKTLNSKKIAVWEDFIFHLFYIL